MKLSDQAKRVLINCGTHRQGTAINPRTPEPVLQELIDLGLIGPGHGLTRRGSIAQERVMDEIMDELF
jgi:hypothetical protein